MLEITLGIGSIRQLVGLLEFFSSDVMVGGYGLSETKLCAQHESCADAAGHL